MIKVLGCLCLGCRLVKLYKIYVVHMLIIQLIYIRANLQSKIWKRSISCLKQLCLWRLHNFFSSRVCIRKTENSKISSELAERPFWMYSYSFNLKKKVERKVAKYKTVLIVTNPMIITRHFKERRKHTNSYFKIGFHCANAKNLLRKSHPF